MSNATMSIELLAGTNIRDAIVEAKKLAATLHLAYITFSFNGVSMSIGSTANEEEAVDAYNVSIRSGSVGDLPPVISC